MKSELRFHLLVSVVGAWRRACSRATPFPRPRRYAGKPRELCVDRRRGRALGGDVHRTRQGADPSALHQLPSGRRPSASRRREPAASAAGRAWRRRPRPRRCAVRSVIRTPTSSPAVCRAIRNGISRRARWRGRARRLPKFARRSKIPPATADARSKNSIHHIGEDTLVGWAWAPGAGRSPAPGTQKQAGALVEAWVKSGAACPAK